VGCGGGGCDLKTQAPRPGSESQDEWLRLLEEMGGQFWPPENEEEDMPEVGAKYPMMLYDGERECIVYDDKEYDEAKKNGFREHPSMLSAGQAPPKPEKPQSSEVKAAKRPEPQTEVHPGYVPPKAATAAPKQPPPPPPPPPAAKQPEVAARTTTVTVQRTVDGKKPTAPAMPPSKKGA
jgi:hypothetical protein